MVFITSAFLSFLFSFNIEKTWWSVVTVPPIQLYFLFFVCFVFRLEYGFRFCDKSETVCPPPSLNLRIKLGKLYRWICYLLSCLQSYNLEVRLIGLISFGLVVVKEPRKKSEISDAFISQDREVLMASLSCKSKWLWHVWLIFFWFVI